MIKLRKWWVKTGVDKIDEWRQLFKIIGGGATVSIESRHDDKCTIRRGDDGEWVVGMSADTPSELVLHEACHQLYSPFTLPESLLKFIQANPGLKDLANALEDGRVNKTGGDWYSQDLMAYHRKTLKKSDSFKSNVQSFVVEAVANYIFDVGVTQKNPELKRFVEKWSDKINNVVESRNPLATTRLAIEMWPDLNSENQRDQKSRSNIDHATSHSGRRSNICSVVGMQGVDKEDRLPNGQFPKSKPKSFVPSISRSHQNHVYDGDSIRHRGRTELLEVPQDRVVPAHETRLMIESNRQSHTRQMSRMGIPTHRVWEIDHGKMKVFERRERRRGKVIVMVDLSGSMGCWCPRCSPPRPDQAESGYLAFQAVNSVTANVEAEVFGFCSDWSSHDFMIPLRIGNQPQCRNLEVPSYKYEGQYGLPGDNPDCAALMFMDNKLKGLGRDAIAVIVSDGQPATSSCSNSVMHTKELSYALRSQGVRYASILVGPYFRPIYPSEVSAHIGHIRQMKNIQPVMDMVLGR